MLISKICYYLEVGFNVFGFPFKVHSLYSKQQPVFRKKEDGLLFFGQKIKGYEEKVLTPHILVVGIIGLIKTNER